MEEYVEDLKDFLGAKRKVNRKMFKIMGTLYRAFTKGRITYEQVLQKLENLGGGK